MLRKVLGSCCLGLLLVAGDAVAEKSAGQNRTVFDFAEHSWAVGTLHLSKPLRFRDGKILAFPSQITDLLWAPKGAKPRNAMLVHEVFSDDKDKPFLAEGEEIFAPLLLLPQHSYWKDNLPNTPRHEVAGGRRNVFRGDAIPEARRVLKAYLEAYDTKGMDRWPAEIRVVADALNSPVSVLREDAVRFFASYPTLARDFPADAMPQVTSFLGAAAVPVEGKSEVIGALASAKIAAIGPVLEGLATRDDAAGAAALIGLDRLGTPVPADRLPSLAKARTPEVRAWAAAALGKRAGSDPAALSLATSILDDQAEVSAVRDGAAQGLGASNSPVAAAALGKATSRGDSASRAAAQALADSSSPDSAQILVDILVREKGEAALAAAAALSRKSSCQTCSRALEEQHEKHPDEAVRQLIGVILQVPLEHKH